MYSQQQIGRIQRESDRKLWHLTRILLERTHDRFMEVSPWLDLAAGIQANFFKNEDAMKAMRRLMPGRDFQFFLDRYGDELKEFFTTGDKPENRQMLVNAIMVLRSAGLNGVDANEDNVRRIMAEIFNHSKTIVKEVVRGKLFNIHRS